MLWYVYKLYESPLDHSQRVCVCVCVQQSVHREQTHQVDTVHDADAQGHVGFGEVNDLLTLSCDGEAGHC